MNCCSLLLLVSMLFAHRPAASLCTKEPDFCGSSDEKYRIIQHRGKHPTPQPSADKAVICFVWTGGTASVVKMWISVNGRWVAGLPKHSYSYAAVDPGVLRMCQKWPGGQTKNSFLSLTAEAGKTYYVDSPPGKLQRVSEEKGKVDLAKCRYVTIERER